jgi:hypothetical protein
MKTERGGNGGFSLRSRKLLEHCSKTISNNHHPEDVYLSGKKGFKNSNREYFESSGFLFANRILQSNFGGDGTKYNNEFGHHKGILI